MVAIRSESELNSLTLAGQIVAKVLRHLEGMVKPGVTTSELNEKALELTKEFKAKPAFLNYGTPPFPAALCTSINHEVVHGIPSKKVKLKKGDILSMDFGVEKDGYFGDAAITVLVGEVSEEKKKLCEVTKKALYEGLSYAKEGNRLGDISFSIQSYVESKGYSVVREFVGHGIGTSLHEEPQIPNFGKKDTGILLKSGMILAIEPMVNMGNSAVRILNDGWTAITTDGLPSAHFEHTIAITSGSPKILTEIN